MQKNYGILGGTTPQTPVLVSFAVYAACEGALHLVPWPHFWQIQLTLLGACALGFCFGCLIAQLIHRIRRRTAA